MSASIEVLGDPATPGALGDPASFSPLADDIEPSVATAAGLGVIPLRTASEISADIASRLPEGWAWDLSPTSNTRRIFKSLEASVAGFEASAIAQLEEAEPDTAELLLDGYERVLGPDTCLGDPQTLTLAQRRMSATARWIASRGASRADLISLAASYGATITITEFQRTPAGMLRAGGPRVCHPQELTAVIGLPEAQVIPFTAGQSRAGDALGKIQRSVVIECVVRRAAPSRVTLVFSYGAYSQGIGFTPIGEGGVGMGSVSL